jgi:peptidoglycan/LPS O-acetylase OafA/YrhL
MNTMRIEQLTFTRFIAAISIVIYHYGLNVFPFNISFIEQLFSHANLAVSYFFVLSGFVLTIVYGDKNKINFASFIRNRFARIFPLYLLGIILSIFFGIVRLDLNIEDLILNLLFLQNWIPDKFYAINYPAWSLCAEFFFYLSFPLLFNYLYSKYKLSYLLLIVLFFMIVSVLFFNLFPTDYFRYLPILHLSQFMLGNIGGLIFLEYNKKTSSSFNLILISVVLFLLIIHPFFSLEYENGMIAIFFTFFIYKLSENSGIISGIFKNKSLVYLGEISFGVYILQAPVWLWSRIIFKNIYKITGIMELSYVSIFWINITFLMFFASFCYKYIEIPFKNKINGFKFVTKPLNFQKIHK